MIPPLEPAPSSTASSATPPPEDPCAALARAHAATLAGTHLADLDKPPRGNPPALPPSFGRCIPTPHGKWAMVITAVGEDPPADLACWALVHIDQEGRESRAFPGPSGGGAATCKPTFKDANITYGNWSGVRFDEPVLADLDGDGEPEIFVKRTGSHQNSDVIGTDQIWTYRGGQVILYPPAQRLGVIELRDVDGDGRLDLLTHGRYRIDAGHVCGLLSMEIFPVTGPELMAHGKPDGSFSLDDAEAKAFARTQCPRRPSRLGADRSEIGHDIACALLWGASERDVVRGLAACAPRAARADSSDCPQRCAQAKTFARSFAAGAAPLRLDVP